MQQLCYLESVKPQPPPSLLLGLEPVLSCPGVSRALSEQKVSRSVEQRIVFKFSLEKTSRPLKFTTDSNNSMGKRFSHRPVCLSGVRASEKAESGWRMNRMIVGREHPFGRKSDGIRHRAKH